MPATTVRRSLTIAVLILLALAVRLPGLDAAGLSEDEMDKLHAADSYDHGNFAVDGEHPALMKLSAYGSLKAAAVWNAHTPDTAHISTEAALRAPNAVAGALITGVLFVLVDGFFGFWTAVLAAWLWAFDVNAVAMNRVAKEDTFVLLFLLCGAALYERAKRVGAVDPRRAQRWFAASGAAFGLMLASKYVPYLFGIHAIYFKAAAPVPGPNRPDKPVYLGALALAFVAGNFPVLDPGNWSTILTFVSEHAITHSGYLFQSHLWANRLSATPFGLPLWFYAAQFLTKIPVLVLLVAIGGACVLARRDTSRGATFVKVFFLLTFIPYSLVATKFLRYMLPSLAMIDVMAAVGLAALAGWASRLVPRPQRALVAIAAVLILASAPAAWTHARPFAALYRNAIGQQLSPTTLWFPPDELYDAGLREATARIVRDARPGAHVVTEAPAVVGFYAEQGGRPDLLITRPGSALEAAPSTSPTAAGTGDWMIVQEGRRYFENEALVERIRQQAPAFSVDVAGFRAVEVYRMTTASSDARRR
jgi:hypothetical protein